jgi:hypothetical protein
MMQLPDLLTTAFFRAIDAARYSREGNLQEYHIKDNIYDLLRTTFASEMTGGNADVIQRNGVRSTQIRLWQRSSFDRDKTVFSLSGERNLRKDLLKLLKSPALSCPKTLYSVSSAASHGVMNQCRNLCAELNQQADFQFEYTLKQQQGTLDGPWICPHSRGARS